MNKTVGVTIGKFMPLHKGHELMIELGSKMLDKLYVVVSGKPLGEISLASRYNWVCEFVEKNRLSNVNVIYHIDQSPEPIEIDEHGTVLDVEFQEYWKNEFSKLAPDATHFISSDRYGKTMAELLGISWMPVDPDREMVNISATRIRDNMFENFKYLSDVAKPSFVKKVAIVGPESTGKSTLSKHLANILNCGYANEYGRTLSESLGNDMSIQDFIDIMKAQSALIDIAVKNTNVPLIISDTEAFTTYAFGKKYLGESIVEIYNEAVEQKFDLYVILAPTVDWVDDGTRVMPDQKERERFFDRIVHFCKLHNKRHVIIDETDFAFRTHRAKYEIMNLFG